MISSTTAIQDDCYTAKHAAADGYLIWGKRYNGPANGNDSGTRVAVDSAGYVIVTGGSQSSGTSDAWATIR